MQWKPSKGRPDDAQAAYRGGQQVIVQPGCSQSMAERLLVSLAHVVAEQLIIQVALHIEEGCQQQPFPNPACHSIA